MVHARHLMMSSFLSRCGQDRVQREGQHFTPYFPHKSHHYRNAGQISDVAGKSGLGTSTGCKKQLTDFQEVQLYFKLIAPSLCDWKLKYMNEVEPNTKSYAH